MTALGAGAAAGAGDDVLGVVVGVEAAGHVTGGVESLDHRAVGGKYLHVLVDAQAVQRGEQGAAEPAAVEGRLDDFREAVGLLAVVGVHARFHDVVVVGDGVHELLLGLAFETEQAGQLIQGIGLLHEAGAPVHGNEVVERHAHLHKGGGVGGAPRGAEAQDVVHGVSVEDLTPHAAGLIARSVAEGVVGQALVHEALALAVHLQEGLAADVQLVVGGGEVLAAVGVHHVAAVHAGGHGAAVEDDRRTVHVLHAAGPKACAQAVAIAARRVAGGGAAGGHEWQVRADHLGVGRVAARGQQRALGGVHAHEALGGGEHGAGDAVAVVVELHEVIVVADLMPRFLNVPFQNIVAHGVLVGGVEEVLDGGCEVVGAPGGMVGFHGGDAEGLAVGLHDGGDPLDHLLALVQPRLDDALVHAARGVARELVEHLHLVDRIGDLQRVLGVDCAHVLAGVAHARALLGHDEIEPEVARGTGGHHAGVACAYDEEVGVAGGHDVGIGHRGLLAEPIGVGLLRGGFGVRGLLGARCAASQRAGGKRPGSGQHACLQKAAAGKSGRIGHGEPSFSRSRLFFVGTAPWRKSLCPIP